MRRRTENVTAVTLLLFLSILASFQGWPAYGQDVSKPAVVMREWESPTTALATLQKLESQAGNVLVVQGEMDTLIAKDGGGACATATGVNALLTIGYMAGLEPKVNPYRLGLAAIDAQPNLLHGRVTNAGLVELIRQGQSQLGTVTLDVDVHSAPNSKHATDKRFWPEAEGPNLKIISRQLKVLSYTVTEQDGAVLGRHFVLLKENVNNLITVVDPTGPTKDRQYVLEYRASTKDDPARIFLLNPAGKPARTRVFELNTVFTVTIVNGVSPLDPHLRDEVALVYVKQHIADTAKLLKGRKEYTSPRLWREQTAYFGLPGLDIPTKHGGAGWSAVRTLEIFRYAGEFNLNFRDIVGGAHARALLHSEEPKVQEIVRQVASGKGYMAIAITEPTAGSDVSAIKSTSKKVEGGYLLTGTKRFNARLGQATHVILFTQGTTGVPGKLSVFVVPINTPGLKIEELTAHGLTGNSFGGVSYENLFVPDSHLIGKDGEGLRVFFNHFLYWRLMQTAAAIGTGQDALRQMAQRIEKREAFGAPIGRFTHLQQPIGQYTTQLQMAYALARQAAELIDRDDYRGAHAIICGLKAEGVEIALQAVDAAMRAFGGEGYSTEVDLGDRLKDLQGLRIADGTTDVMRMEVVRRVYGEQFWKMAVQSKE